MYVCVCNAINCRTVRQAVSGGADSVSSVFKHSGKKPQCGRCFTMIRDMVEEGRQAGPAAPPMPVMMAAE